MTNEIPPARFLEGSFRPARILMLRRALCRASRLPTFLFHYNNVHSTLVLQAYNGRDWTVSCTELGLHIAIIIINEFADVLRNVTYL